MQYRPILASRDYREFGSFASSRIRRISELPSEIGRGVVTRVARREEIKQVLDEARRDIPELGGAEIALRLFDHNPDTFRIVERVDGKGRRGCVVYLPFREAGAVQLVSGQFNMQTLDLDHIAISGEPPAAVYVCLIYTPGLLVKAVALLAHELMRGHLAAGAPYFGRHVNTLSKRFFARIGFVPAKDYYPDAPEDLVVYLPGAPTVTQASERFTPDVPGRGLTGLDQESSLTVRVARTMEDIAKIFSIRAATFISEQHCPYAEEYDGNDFCAVHLLGELNGEPIACLRMRFFANFVKLERLAIRNEYRSKRISGRLIREAISFCQKKGYERFYGHARADLLDFWERFGFRPIEGRPGFSFSGVDYIEILFDAQPVRGAIAIGVDPYVTIRPEGEWDRPGVLDHSATRNFSSAHRSRRISDPMHAVPHFTRNDRALETCCAN